MTTRQRGLLSDSGSSTRAWTHTPGTLQCPRQSPGHQVLGSPYLRTAGSRTSETVTAWGQDKGFGGRVRSVALAGLEIVGERNTFLHSCDWYVENVSTSQELLSCRKPSKYYFQQTVSFKGLYQTYFIMCVVSEGPDCEPEPSKRCESGKGRT